MAAPVVLWAALTVGGLDGAASAATPTPPTTPATTPVTAPATTPATVSGTDGSTPPAAPSAPLVIVPQGCPASPTASVVFVGRVIAKDFRAARYQIIQVRAGTTTGYSLGNLVDIRYGNDVEYLTVDDEYLVGAVPQGVDLALTSKVREAKPLLGGNAIVGLTEKSSECPPIEDPVRTFHVDGSEISASLLKGLTTKKRDIALAFIKPIVAVLVIVLALVLIRWLFTLVFLAFRRAAEKEPATAGRRE